jgi:hypothetical protein
VARESNLEKYAREQITASGGLMRKWTCPGRRGAPDDLVFWRFPMIDLVEFKAPGEQLDPLQIDFHIELEALGWHVWLLDSKEAVDRWISHRAPIRHKRSIFSR